MGDRARDAARRARDAMDRARQAATRDQDAATPGAAEGAPEQTAPAGDASSPVEDAGPSGEAPVGGGAPRDDAALSYDTAPTDDAPPPDDTLARVRSLRVPVGLSLVGLLILGLIVVAFTGSGPSRSGHQSVSSRRTTTTTTPPRTTFLGADGVESSAVIAENRLPGTTSWAVAGPPRSGLIEGFADHIDAQVGDVVGLYVSTDAPTFTVTAYRMGYYGGAGARQVWSSASVSGVTQPACPVTPVTNMVACDNWTRSTSFTVTSAFVPGDYLMKLVSSTGAQSYVLLTVTDPTSHATYLMVARSLTEQGWNSYGGFDFYQGHGACPTGAPTYPVCNRARVVSFDRPFTADAGPSDFLANEYPLVRLCEQQGLDVTYTTDVALDSQPDLMSGHKAILSLGHDETWTTNERQGAETALSHGVNIAFFGAAAVLRHARLQPSPLGPNREEVDYRNSTEDPLNGNGDPLQVTGNTFASPPTSWPETHLVGELYSGYTEPGTEPLPFVVYEPSAWLFKGTGLRKGAQVPGVIASDFDHLDPTTAPAGLEVLGHSPVPLAQVYTNQGKWGADTYADTTYYTDPVSNGGVFDSGTVNWIHALSPCASALLCPSAAVTQMTGNLLWLFGQGPAGGIDPSVSNIASVTPKGS